MGASEVLEALEKQNKELTVRELSQLLDISHIAISRILRSLVKDPTESVKFKELTPEEKCARYGHHLNARVSVFWIEK